MPLKKKKLQGESNDLRAKSLETSAIENANIAALPSGFYQAESRFPRRKVIKTKLNHDDLVALMNKLKHERAS